MSGNVSLFPVLGIVPAAEKKDVVWIITVGATTESKYSCHFRSKEGYWRVCIETRDLITAISLVELCGTMISNGEEREVAVK